MIVKLLIEHHLECLSLKGGCRGWSESSHVKMPHCWKSHAMAHYYSSRAIILTHYDAYQVCLPLGAIDRSFVGLNNI